MRRQLILHLFCINLIAAAWIGVLIKLGRTSSAETGSRSQHSMDNVPAKEGSPRDIDSALIAEKAGLETEIGGLIERLQSLQDGADGQSQRIEIPKTFFDTPGHFSLPIHRGRYRREISRAAADG